MKRGNRRKGTGKKRPHGGTPVKVTRVGGGLVPPRGKRGPPGIPPRTCVTVVAGSLWRLLHHNNGSHLDGRIMDDAV